MADYPLTELGNKTPLQAAHKPNMDYLAAMGEVGLVLLHGWGDVFCALLVGVL
jgi:2,3-bisphosphoglycerate-independent phosphoglycerate mutase